MTTSQLPQLTPADVERWVGQASLHKGQSYFATGAIFNARRAGMALKAMCRGSSAAAYQLQVTLGAQVIATADCSCPVGAGGRCKHIAALLLTWLDAPDSFREAPDLPKLLAKRSKEDLIALIQQMLQRQPDLEVLLEMPLPGSKASQQPLDPQVIRRQVQHAFDNPHSDWGWNDPYEIVQALKPLFDLADSYLSADNPYNAAVIYQQIAGVTLDYDDAVAQDEDGRLGRVLWDCIENLGECLMATKDPPLRESILRTVFDIYAGDMKMGGLGISDPAPGILQEYTTEQERQVVAGWIDALIPSMSDWSRRALGGLQLNLQIDMLDDDAFLRVCRETGRLEDLVDRLLEIGRIDEAVAEARQSSDYQLLALATLFVHHRQAQLGRQLIQDRMQNSQDSRLVAWLIDYAQKHGDQAEALAYAQQLFWMRPALDEYFQIRELAEPLGQWQPLHAQILAKLASKKEHDLLIDIYLDEKQIDLALQALEQLRANRRPWGYISMDLQVKVAKAAEETRPSESIRLYMQVVESLINQRGRDKYADAAAYLQRVQRLYQHMDDLPAWQSLITRLREEHRKLRALQEELKRAKL